MIYAVFVTIGIVVFALGFALGRYSQFWRPRCTAMVGWGHYDKKDRFRTTSQHRCPERVDPRCDNGFCIKHCRDEDRCNGLHVSVGSKAKLLRLTP